MNVKTIKSDKPYKCYEISGISLDLGNNPAPGQVEKELARIPRVLNVLGAMENGEVKITWSHKFSAMTGPMANTWDVSELYNAVANAKE